MWGMTGRDSKQRGTAVQGTHALTLNHGWDSLWRMLADWQMRLFHAIAHDTTGRPCRRLHWQVPDESIVSPGMLQGSCGLQPLIT